MKFCKDCARFTPGGDGLCDKPVDYNLVSGAPYFNPAFRNRRDEKLCGTGGAWFAPKTKPEPTFTQKLKDFQMNEIENAIKVLQDCYKHPGANAAIAGLRALHESHRLAYPGGGAALFDKLWHLTFNCVTAHAGNRVRTDLLPMQEMREFLDHLCCIVDSPPAYTAQEPLTIEKIVSMDYRGTLDEHIRAVRMAEAAHGITKGKA